MAYLFKSIRSSDYRPAGVVDIEFLGGIVGELASWTLTRCGDEGPKASLYDLRATFTFVAEALWDDPEYEKRIVLSLSPRKQYRLRQADDFATVRHGLSLLMEGVTIHAVDNVD